MGKCVRKERRECVPGENKQYIWKQYPGQRVRYNENQHCSGTSIDTYNSLAEAKQACNENKECGVITDFDCDDDHWYTCTGSGVAANSSGSCSWTKLKFGKVLVFIK